MSALWSTTPDEAPRALDSQGIRSPKGWRVDRHLRQRARVSLRWPFGRGGQRHGHLRLLLLSPPQLTGQGQRRGGARPGPAQDLDVHGDEAVGTRQHRRPCEGRGFISGPPDQDINFVTPRLRRFALLARRGTFSRSADRPSLGRGRGTPIRRPAPRRARALVRGLCRG